MTVKAIRLENFMAFADTDWIELRPITLLFGRNSSGKSAIIRALRLLRQNLVKPIDPDYATLKFVAEHGVDLGSYEETVHGGKEHKERVIRFGFRCAVPEASDLIRAEINIWRRENNLPAIVATDDDTLTITLSFGRGLEREAELIGIELSCVWQISDGANNNTVLLFAQLLDVETRNEISYDDWWLDTDLPNWFEQDWKSTTFEFPNGFLPSIKKSPIVELDRVFADLAQSINAFLEGTEHIGPIRPEPQRTYMLDEIARQQWRQQGWDALIDFLEGNKLDDSVEEKVDGWLKELNLGKKILPPTEYLGKDATVSRIIIKEKGSGLSINLKNTGYGASQVIPVVIQSLTARQRVREGKPRLVVIEQPELHLHPNAQAQLADVFVDEIYTFPDTLPDNFDLNAHLEDHNNLSRVSFLIETHSEHLLLRLRLRIAKTKLTSRTQFDCKWPLSKSGFRAYFVDRRDGISTCELIQVDEFGEYIVEPDGFVEFFGDDFAEVMKIGQARSEWEALSDDDTIM